MILKNWLYPQVIRQELVTVIVLRGIKEARMNDAAISRLKLRNIYMCCSVLVKSAAIKKKRGQSTLPQKIILPIKTKKGEYVCHISKQGKNNLDASVVQVMRKQAKKNTSFDCVFSKYRYTIYIPGNGINNSINNESMVGKKDERNKIKFVLKMEVVYSGCETV